MMLILKRLVVWLLETSCEVLLLSLFLIFYHGSDQHASAKDVLVLAASTAFMFFTTGYLLTTALFRAFWRSQRLWFYSAIATTLFLFHFEILNVVAGGVFESPERLWIRVAGACIVLACTLAGSYALRKWATLSLRSGPRRSSQGSWPKY